MSEWQDKHAKIAGFLMACCISCMLGVAFHVFVTHKNATRLEFYCKPEREQWLLDCLTAYPITAATGDINPVAQCRNESLSMFCYYRQKGR